MTLIPFRVSGPELPLAQKEDCILLLPTLGELYLKRTGSTSILPMGTLLCAPGPSRTSGMWIRASRTAKGFGIMIGRNECDELYLRLGVGYHSPLLSREASVYPIHNTELVNIIDLFQQLEYEHNSSKRGYEEIMLLRCTELMIRLARIIPEPLTSDYKENSLQIDDILLYIRSNYQRPLTLDEIAQRMGYSPTYLSRFFRDKTGDSLFEYLNRLRIGHACLMLKRSNKDILSISIESGFNSLSFFNRAFRKFTNLSPSDYRKTKRTISPASAIQ